MSWSEIADRAEAAKGPDRELDLSVARMIHPRVAGSMLPLLAERYTGSVDAVLALIEATEPSAAVKTWAPHHVAAVRIAGHWGERPGETAPLALLASFAQAMALSSWKGVGHEQA